MMQGADRLVAVERGEVDRVWNLVAREHIVQGEVRTQTPRDVNSRVRA